MMLLAWMEDEIVYKKASEIAGGKSEKERDATGGHIRPSTLIGCVICMPVLG